MSDPHKTQTSYINAGDSDESDVASPRPSTGSTEQFDALIDLLATDGTEGAGNNAGGLGLELRDTEGRLDFTKIRSFFVQRNPDEGDSTAVHTVPGPSPNDAQRASDMAVETLASPLSGLSRTPRSTPSVSDAIPPSSSLNYSDFNALETEKERTQQRARHTPSPAPSGAQVVRNLERNLQLANEELRALRGRYMELQSMVSELLDHPDGAVRSRAYNKPPPCDVRREATRQDGRLIPDATNTTVVPLARGDLPSSIEPLPETQAKLNLADLSVYLGLPIDPHVAQSSRGASHPKPGPNDVHGVEDIRAAVQFLRQVDELVWRRTRYPDAPWGDHLPVFSVSNIMSLLERLELWESVARGRIAD
ncbi:hypothetical protein OF83DRAFT_457327 [Amylostereum chailletii]|nr:hypothetical protein OF83DRAFT_457327 [Amylostereum chailletii]